MLEKLRFNGAVVVVTGGGAGIGQAAAEALAEMGAQVVVSGRNMEPLQETLRDDPRARRALRGHRRRRFPGG